MNRVLVVEDEPMLRDVYVTLFKLQDYVVQSAVNGKDAVDMLKSYEPDVIVLDALMPVMGGIEFLETVNPRDNFPRTRILLLSNLSDPKTISKGKKLGVHKYLLKADVSPTQLLEAVRELSSA
jgi:DNA-binding NarL/FixJ family response regulator